MNSMKMLMLSAAALVVAATTASAGQKLPCNPAVQNWANGSGDTCPDFGAGMQKPSPVKVVAVVAPPPPPPPPEEEPATVY